nr:hypothetical protein [Tanacetum cinerariifolium]
MSDLEAAVAAKASKVTTLADCDSLRNEVVGEAKMREEFTSQQDAVVRHFDEWITKLDARIADVRRDMDNDLYPHMLTIIAGRRWVVRHGFCFAVYKCARFVECRSAMGKVISMTINKGIQQCLEAGIEHRKACRSLAQVEAYDPRTGGKYVVNVSEFENVSFPMLEELEGLKDSSLALIMSALTLKDEHGNTDTTPELRQFHPSFDQVTIPIYFEFGSISSEMLLSDVIPAIRGSSEKSWLCLPPSSASGGVFSSAPRHDSSLGVTDYQVSPLVLSGDRAPATQPPVTQTHDDLFDTSILDKHAGCSLVRDRFAITAYIDGDAYMISNFSRSSSRTSRLSSRASSFMAWSIFAHLNKGIPISTGITTSLSHTRENEGADEELSEKGSPRVIVYEYDGLPMQPVAPPSPDYIPGPEEPQTPPAPHDEDGHEPMFIQPHDPDYVPEPMYPEYIPLEDEHDPEEYEDDKTEDDLVDYPMDGGDDDSDSSGDDADDEDEDEEEHLLPADSVIGIPTVELVSLLEGTELSYHHPPLTLLPLKLGLLSGFRILYPFHQR